MLVAHLVKNPLIRTTTDEAFMQMLLAMNDTRKRVAILFVLSFLAIC